MSSAEWIYEPSSGRYWRLGRDSLGRTVREYSDQAAGQFASNQSSNVYITPRSEAYYEPSSRNYQQESYADSATREPYVGGQRSRQSVSYGRPDDPPGQSRGYDQSESTTINNDSSSRYRSSGYPISREGRAYHREGGNNPQSESRDVRTSGLEATSEIYDDAVPRARQSTIADPSELAGGMGALTVNEAVGYDTYYTAGSSALPGSRGQSSPSLPRVVPTSINVEPIAAYEQPIRSFANQSSSYTPGSSSYGTVPATNYDNATGQDKHSYSKDTQCGENRGTKSRKGKEADPGPSNTLAAQARSRRYIRGTPDLGTVERLDESYKMRKKDYKEFFRQGRVFQTLWTDACGETAKEDSETFQSAKHVATTRFGEKVYTKIRRFVVVRQGETDCTCLPITTYNHRGVGKRGIRPEEHGQIYGGQTPEIIKGIRMHPLKVNLSKGAERISKDSLVNYGAVYTVQTNVKVKDVGELDSASRKLLRRYYNEVMTLKDESDSYGQKQTPKMKAATLIGVGAGVTSGTSTAYLADSLSVQPLQYPQSSNLSNPRYASSPQDRQSSSDTAQDRSWPASNALPSYNTSAISTSQPTYANPPYSTAQNYSTADPPSNAYRTSSMYYPAGTASSSNPAGFTVPTQTPYTIRDPAISSYGPGSGPVADGQYSRRDYRESSAYSSSPQASTIPVYTAEQNSATNFPARRSSLYPPDAGQSYYSSSQPVQYASAIDDRDDIDLPPRAEILARRESSSASSRPSERRRHRDRDKDRR